MLLNNQKVTFFAWWFHVVTGVYIITRGVAFPPLKFRKGDFLPQSANPGAVRTPRKIINRQYTSFEELKCPL